MLPARSKRYAGLDGEIPRLRLATGWQLALIALIMLGLLAVIFPRKALIEKLLTQEQLDPLTLSYVRNLQRTDAGNLDLALLLARVQRATLGLGEIERLLDPVMANGDARQRDEALTLLIGFYQRALEKDPAGARYARIRNPLAVLLRDIRPQDVSPYLAGQMANAAFRIELPELGLAFLNRASKESSTDVLVQQARNSLGVGRYTLAAEYYFLARRQTHDRERARSLFHSGIDTLMQASLFKQAMTAADREIGDLDRDPETLRYLARTALAAGDPPHAVGYARRLVFAGFGELAGGAR
ncbi:MAG TPA: hypothetical protein VGN52_01655 [Burkholderiales bacterium]|jgi:hypothetical protein